MNFLTNKSLIFEFLTEHPLSFVANTGFKDEIFILLEVFIKIGGLYGDTVRTLIQKSLQDKLAYRNSKEKRKIFCIFNIHSNIYIKQNLSQICTYKCLHVIYNKILQVQSLRHVKYVKMCILCVQKDSHIIPKFSSVPTFYILLFKDKI